MPIDETTGVWREYGFGLVSVYKQDFLTVGGFDKKLEGWGLEDVDLYTKFVASKIQIFRAKDQELQHIYHPQSCIDPGYIDSSKRLMCEGSRASLLSSSKMLAKQFLQHEP